MDQFECINRYNPVNVPLKEDMELNKAALSGSQVKPSARPEVDDSGALTIWAVLLNVFALFP
jgi:hypothetical protein